MLSLSPLVLRHASVISSVSGFDSFNAQHADPLVRSCDHYAIICDQPSLDSTCIGMDPRNFKGEITFVDSASGGDHLVQVYLIRAKIERNDLGKNFGFEFFVSSQFS